MTVALPSGRIATTAQPRRSWTAGGAAHKFAALSLRQAASRTRSSRSPTSYEHRCPRSTTLPCTSSSVRRGRQVANGDELTDPSLDPWLAKLAACGASSTDGAAPFQPIHTCHSNIAAGFVTGVLCAITGSEQILHGIHRNFARNAGLFGGDGCCAVAVHSVDSPALNKHEILQA